MSPWGAQPQHSPRSARKARADAIISNSATSTSMPNPNHSAPNWLLRQNAPSLDPADSRNNSNSRISNNQRTSSASSTPFTSASAMLGRFVNSGDSDGLNPTASRDDDFIMVDMLDGSHRANKHGPNSLSKNSDSILSLPPVQSALPDTRYTTKRPTRHVSVEDEYIMNRPSPAPPLIPPADPSGHRKNLSEGMQSVSSKFPPRPPSSTNLAALERPNHPQMRRPPSTGSLRTLARPQMRRPPSTGNLPSLASQQLLSDDSGLPVYIPTTSNQHQQPQQITVAQLAEAASSASKKRPPNHRHSASNSGNFDPSNRTHSSRSSIDYSEQSQNFQLPFYKQKSSGSDIDPNEPDAITPLNASYHYHYHQRNPSIESSRKAHDRMGSYKWFDEETNSYAPSPSQPPIYLSEHARKAQKDGKISGKYQNLHKFEPSAWGWRRPAEEDSLMPSGAWIYLLLIGVITFISAFSINLISSSISSYLFEGIASFVGSFYGSFAHTVTLAILRGLSLATSFAIVLKFSPHYGAGSGIPEMKCVLGGVLMPQMLNWETLVGKMAGLTFSLASGISIGRLGPFIHMSCVSAALVSKLNAFPALRDNTRFQLQALSAAMAAGVGATFGAPLGGTLLAVEIMSTYYYIHWIPMALYCSIMGYYVLVVVTKDTPTYFTAENVDLQGASTVEHLISFIVLGAMCGAIGACLVHFTTKLLKFRQRYFKNAFPWRTGGMLFGFAITHTFITAYLGGVINLEQRKGLDELFLLQNKSAKFWFPHAIKIFGIKRLDASVALIVAMFVKFILTGFSIVMPVPAGVFMPIFQIGALFGRAFGEAWSVIPLFNWLDPMGCAIVGAAAMTAGSLHTVSIAVVMLELTREAIDVLPLAIGVIVSYGVSKRLCSDLFSELIKVRKLPYILGLRERYPWETKQFFEDVSSVEASSVMRTDFAFVTPTSTRREIWDLLNTKGRKRSTTSCALLSDRENRCLWGTISQDTLWSIVSEDIRPGKDPHATNNWDKIREPEYGTFNASESSTRRGFETIQFLRDFDPKIGHPLVDMGPMQTSVRTPFWKVIHLFQMLSMGHLYILDDGATVGCIRKSDVIKYSIQLEHESKMKRRKEEASKQRQLRKKTSGGVGGRNGLGSDVSDAFKKQIRGSHHATPSHSRSVSSSGAKKNKSKR